nr:cupin domain-containing protein [uncultured Pseudoxanthomonas sp.]
MMSDEMVVSGLDTFRSDRAAPAWDVAGFEDLILPLERQDFMRGYWQRRPYHVKRNVDGYFDGLISLTDIDRMLSSTAFRDGEIRVARDGVVVSGREISADGVVARNRVWNLYADGATVVFEHLNRRHAGLLRLSAKCEQEFKVPLRTNAYLTPPASKGFDLHYDTHDVLILQIAGSKTWQVHDDPLPLPHELQTFKPSWALRSQRLAEIRLEPGDVLYLPRGFIHGASANEDVSFHITMGIRSLPLRDICETALRRFLLLRHEFRPVGRFDNIGGFSAAAKRALLEHLDEVDLAGAFRDAELSFLRKRTRPQEGRLRELLDPPRIERGSRMRLTPGAIVTAVERDGNAILFFDRRNMVLPEGVMPAIDFMRTRRSFLVSELPGLEEESRLILARKLHEARLLDIADGRKHADAGHL